jgi:gamma-glutamyl:cysteine ligase YbdK (ATP-grasp superfamily)
MRNCISTFMDGEDCPDCKSYEKELAKQKEFRIAMMETMKDTDRELSQALEAVRVLREALGASFEDYILYSDCSGTWDGSENPSILIEHSDDCLKCKMSTALEKTAGYGEGENVSL